MSAHKSKKELCWVCWGSRFQDLHTGWAPTLIGSTCSICYGLLQTFVYHKNKWQMMETYRSSDYIDSMSMIEFFSKMGEPLT